MASFSVVNNIGSVNAQSKLYETNIGLSRTLARLSSGLRINQSGDDAAGLAVANKFRSDVAILNVGVRNANDGLSALQIADGALDNISRLLDRAATLATQSATGTTTTASRTVLQEEFASILNEIDREAGIASLTTAHQLLGLHLQRRLQRNSERELRCRDCLDFGHLLGNDRDLRRCQLRNHEPPGSHHRSGFSARFGRCGSEPFGLRRQHCAVPDRQQDGSAEPNPRCQHC